MSLSERLQALKESEKAAQEEQRRRKSEEERRRQKIYQEIEARKSNLRIATAKTFLPILKSVDKHYLSRMGIISSSVDDTDIACIRVDHRLTWRRSGQEHLLTIRVDENSNLSVIGGRKDTKRSIDPSSTDWRKQVDDTIFDMIDKGLTSTRPPDEPKPINYNWHRIDASR